MKLNSPLIILLALCLLIPIVSAQNEPVDYTWRVEFSTTEIWIGESFEVVVYGYPETWFMIKFVNLGQNNITFYQDMITDMNGTALLPEFEKFSTEEAGRYRVDLYVDDTIRPVGYVDIMYDEIVYLFIHDEKLQEYFGIDLDEMDFSDPRTRKFIDVINSMNAQVNLAIEEGREAKTMGWASFCGLFFFVMFFTYFFWDDIIFKWETMRQKSGKPRSRWRDLFKMSATVIEHGGRTVMSEEPVFDSGPYAGETKHGAEKIRREKLHTRKYQHYSVELIEKTPPETSMSKRLKASLIKSNRPKIREKIMKKIRKKKVKKLEFEKELEKEELNK